MSAQVSSAVFVVRGPLVPDTVTPCAAAACRSMEAFCMPVVISSLRSGSWAKQFAVEAGPLPHGHDHGRAVQRGHQRVAGQMLADGHPLRPVRLARQRVLLHQPLVVVQGHHRTVTPPPAVDQLT